MKTDGMVQSCCSDGVEAVEHSDTNPPQVEDACSLNLSPEPIFQHTREVLRKGRDNGGGHVRSEP